MERMIANIMAECDRLGVSSVAFPAIGTGGHVFPNDTVAKTMLQAISTYLHTHPSTTVKQVLLVIFEEKTYKAFQSVMQTSTSVPAPSYTPGAVQQTKLELSSNHNIGEISRCEDQGGHHSTTKLPPAGREVQKARSSTKQDLSSHVGGNVASAIQLRRGGLTDHQVCVYVNAACL